MYTFALCNILQFGTIQQFRGALHLSGLEKGPQRTQSEANDTDIE